MLAYEASVARGEMPFEYSERIEHKLDVVAAQEIIDRKAIQQHAVEYIAKFTPEAKYLRSFEAEDNARTAIFEALTASGHMSRVELVGRADEVHAQVMTRLLNGYYRPNIPEHERARVFQEICEELTIYETYLQTLTGDLPPDIKVTTISDFADPLGPLANKLGYRSANKKGMIRETSFRRNENGELVRVIKQISRSNSDAETTINVLSDSGVTVSRSGYADIDLLGTQLMGSKIGAIEIMKRLDRHAGMAVMYGEYKQADTVSYEDLEMTSLLREARVEPFIEELAELERTLDNKQARGEISQSEWTREYGTKLRDIIRAICIIEPSYTKDALGEKVVEAYHRAHAAFVGGDSAGASGIASGASGQESSIVVCGMEVSASTITTDSVETSNRAVEKMLEKSKWKWTTGYCRESLCPNNKKKTKVGPCNVCVNCQHIYDNGKRPYDIYSAQQEQSALQEALYHSQKGETTKSRLPNQDMLEKIETKIHFGGAIDVYRDKVTGAVGTKKELVGIN